MALNVRIQAACLLLLLLASLTSASAPHQKAAAVERVGDLGVCRKEIACRKKTQLADLQTQDTAGATAGLMPGLQRLRRRDTHFPICIFCCGCCHPSKCGICCKT